MTKVIRAKRVAGSLMLLLFCTVSAIGQIDPDPSVQIGERNNQCGILVQTASPGDYTFSLLLNREEVIVPLQNGFGFHPIPVDAKGKLVFLETEEASSLIHLARQHDGTYRIRPIPLWLSILPPLFAILLALTFKEVVLSLFIGIWAGAFIAGGLRIESLYYIILSLLEVVQKYMLEALADTGHMAVIIFSIMIGGMVAVISRNGGMAGIVQALSRFATGPKSTQLITWLLGVAIFFDDYANTLIVGNTMRSVTDRFRISREKLAYIVDSTAAPVSAVAFITTWIGAELGYIGDGIQLIADIPNDTSPYSLFISSLKYSFYPLFTLLFILFLIRSGRDFGPMWKAEERARRTGQVSPAATPEEDEPNMEDLSPVEGAPRHWSHAAFPVLTVILVTLFGLIDTGMTASYDQLRELGLAPAQHTWGAIWQALPGIIETEQAGFSLRLGKLIGNADSYTSLLWASLSGLLLALVITLSRRIMGLFDAMHTMVTGFKTMLPALIILASAWALAEITIELHTADYLTTLLEGRVSPLWLPSLVFILAALISFSTGSSWSTMAILYPIAIPSSWALCAAAGLDPAHTMQILLNVIATVLGASVLGDHCSPISDTTILSSLASDCNHIDHVRTQMPYALVVGSVSLASTTISAFSGGGAWISAVCFILGLLVLFFVIRSIGRPIQGDEPSVHSAVP